jgi:hypothetical protein
METKTIRVGDEIQGDIIGNDGKPLTMIVTEVKCEYDVMTGKSKIHYTAVPKI